MSMVGMLRAPARMPAPRRRASNWPTTCRATCAAAPATGRSSTPGSACSSCRRCALDTAADRARLLRAARRRPAAGLHRRAGRALLCAAHGGSAGGAARAQPEARLLAGCTDIGLWVNKQFARCGDLIYLGEVAELSRIESRADGTLRIGAGATLEDAWARAGRSAIPNCTEMWLRFAVAAGAPCRHDGRQRRQRLADRRQRAGADGARRHAGAAPRCARARAWRSMTSTSTT